MIASLLLLQGPVLTLFPFAAETPDVLLFAARAVGEVPDAMVHALDAALLTAGYQRRVFGRVVTMQDEQAQLALEAQRQLLDCGEASCMAETMGALGAHDVVQADLAAVMDAGLLTVRLVRFGRSDAVGGASARCVP